MNFTVGPEVGVVEVLVGDVTFDAYDTEGLVAVAANFKAKRIRRFGHIGRDDTTSNQSRGTEQKVLVHR